MGLLCYGVGDTAQLWFSLKILSWHQEHLLLSVDLRMSLSDQGTHFLNFSEEKTRVEDSQSSSRGQTQLGLPLVLS
jgi:hypothetical protein